MQQKVDLASLLKQLELGQHPGGAGILTKGHNLEFVDECFPPCGADRWLLYISCDPNY